MPRTAPAALCLACWLAAAAAAGGSGDYVEFSGEHLRQGRALWLENCEGCHGYGIGGAPVPMRPRDWETRLARPRAVLYEHALNGFFGPDDSMMPARGGNHALTDEQVRTAVDYMAELAGFYIKQRR